jgi:hypothetical protein
MSDMNKEDVDVPHRLKHPIEVKRTDTIHCWQCAYCACVQSIIVPLGETAPAIPLGWIWHPYHSARFPKLNPRALGCCADHAIRAAKVLHEESVHAVEKGYVPHE